MVVFLVSQIAFVHLHGKMHLRKKILQEAHVRAERAIMSARDGKEIV